MSSYPGFGRGQGQSYSPLDPNSGLPYESPGTYSQPFFSSGVGNASSSGVGSATGGVGNAAGRVGGSASYPGYELPERQPGNHRQSTASLYSIENLPPPPPGPPPLSSVNPRPDFVQNIGSQSPPSTTRPPLPPRESQFFSESLPRPELNREGRVTLTSSTLFPSPGINGDDQNFLLDPINKVDTFYTVDHIPYKDHTGRQLRHILIGSSLRFFITVALCGAYILSTISWQKRVVLGEGRKRMYNAITTGISIALGLNLMSAFKDLALNMRWPILSAKKRNLVELDLILRSDSLVQLCRLALLSKRPIVVILTVIWLLINIAAQGGIAMLNLTYGFEGNTDAVLMTGKNVSLTDMRHFWPQIHNPEPTMQDEEYMAHLYGGLAYNYLVAEIEYMPKAGDIYRTTNANLWFHVNESYAEFRFIESSPFVLGDPIPPAVYTDRTIRVDYACSAHRVTAGGDGRAENITVANIGNLTVSHTRPNFLTYFTEQNNTCTGDPRCSIVQVFEASETKPWYYNCTVKVGQTTNDPDNRSQISDRMAYIAGSSIAQMGYANEVGQEAQYYPQNSAWGVPENGNKVAMGQTVATYALGSLVGASMFNPVIYYNGTAPKAGFKLEVRHPKFFYLIIGLLCGCQFLFCVVVAVLSNRVKVGPDGHLQMSMLLRPIADALKGVSDGEENKAFAKAKRNTMVRYEKSRNGRWELRMF